MGPKSKTYRSQCGFGLAEMMVVLCITTLALGFAISNARNLENPADVGAQTTLAFFKQLRAKAVNSTQAYTISPANGYRLQVASARTCNETPTVEQGVYLELPRDTRFSSQSWSVCFSSRGLPQTAETVQITHQGMTKQVEVLLGGAIRSL